MRNILKFFGILDDLKDGCKAEPDKRNDNIVLKVVASEKTIAYLSTEDQGKVFTLTYTDAFPTSGVPPFNMKLSERSKIEIGKTYRSEVLWYAFAARIPSPSRPDFQEALDRAGLKGNEPVLEIIGKLSQRSISRSWTIHINDEQAA